MCSASKHRAVERVVRMNSARRPALGSHIGRTLLVLQTSSVFRCIGFRPCSEWELRTPSDPEIRLRTDSNTSTDSEFRTPFDSDPSTEILRLVENYYPALHRQVGILRSAVYSPLPCSVPSQQPHCQRSSTAERLVNCSRNNSDLQHCYR